MAVKFWTSQNDSLCYIPYADCKELDSNRQIDSHFDRVGRGIRADTWKQLQAQLHPGE